MEGRRCGSHRAELTGTVTREFTQLRNTLHDGRAYCCLSGIIWATSARLRGCDSALRAPGVPVYIVLPEPP